MYVCKCRCIRCFHSQNSVILIKLKWEWINEIDKSIRLYVHIHTNKHTLKPNWNEWNRMKWNQTNEGSQLGKSQIGRFQKRNLRFDWIASRQLKLAQMSIVWWWVSSLILSLLSMDSFIHSFTHSLNSLTHSLITMILSVKLLTHFIKNFPFHSFPIRYECNHIIVDQFFLI